MGTSAGLATAVKVPVITLVLGVAAALWLLVGHLAVSRADVQPTPAGEPAPATGG